MLAAVAHWVRKDWSTCLWCGVREVLEWRVSRDRTVWGWGLVGFLGEEEDGRDKSHASKDPPHSIIQARFLRWTRRRLDALLSEAGS